MICCIAGMHRSGTSLAAGWLAHCGLALSAERWIEADISNPTGYYEDLDFVRLHAGHLRNLRRASWGWKLTTDHFLSFEPQELAAAQNMVAARNLAYAQWGWKDPRSTLFLLQWKKLLPDLKVILIWRPCAEVVASLVIRGWLQRKRHLLIDPVSAIRLWRSYNQLICTYQQRYPQDTALFALTGFTQNPAKTLHQLNDRLGLKLVPAPFHALFDPQRLHPPSPAWQLLCSLGGCEQLEERLTQVSVA